MSERIELEALVPAYPGEGSTEYTARLLTAAMEHGTNRQCSIGWHGECSQRSDGASAACMCLCHDPDVQVYSVEGDAENGTITTLRTEAGEHSWPPQPGEPATMWACWIMGRSADDASRRAIARQRALQP